jgi:hypothetical protein
MLLLGAVGCAGIHNGGGGKTSEAVAVDGDGIPVNATPEERERLLKDCKMELPTGSHIPERVCRPKSTEPSMPNDDLMRPAQQSWKTGGG